MKTKMLILLSSLLFFAGCAAKETPAIVKSPPIICKSPGPQFGHINIGGAPGTLEIQEEILAEAKKLNMFDPKSDKILNILVLGTKKGCYTDSSTKALFVGSTIVSIVASLAGVQNSFNANDAFAIKTYCDYNITTTLEEKKITTNYESMETTAWIEHYPPHEKYLNRAMAEAQANAIMCKIIDVYWPQKEALIKP